MGPFSRRSAVDRTENALSRALREPRRQVIDLTVSNPTRAGFAPDPQDLAAWLCDPRGARYSPEPFGLLEARRAVCEDLARRGHAIDPARVLLTASTSEAYALLFKLLCDPGDAVLVPTPSYPLLELLARFEDVALAPYTLRYDGRWHIDLDSLRAAARHPRARALVTVHPNNPTGSFLKRDELAALAALGLPIISDEVFADYPAHADASRADSALEAESALCFRLGGLSKAAALPQLKLAWTAVAGPRAAVSEACARLELLADTFLSPAAPVQHALPAILERHAPGVQQAIRARCAENLRTLASALGPDAPADLLHVEGGWYAVLRLPAVMDEERWTLELLRRDGVRVQPGYFYDLGPHPHWVVSLLGEPEDLRVGAARLASRVRAAT